MKKKAVVTRNKNIIVRVSEKEKNALSRMAKSNGISLSDYIRKAVHNRPAVNLRHTRKLLASLDRFSSEINRVGNNINQAIHAIHLANVNRNCCDDEVKYFNGLFKKYVCLREELIKRLDNFYNLQKQK